MAAVDGKCMKEEETAAERAVLKARLTLLPGMPSHLKAQVWEDSSELNFNPAFTWQQARFVLLRFCIIQRSKEACKCSTVHLKSICCFQ